MGVFYTTTVFFLTALVFVCTHCIPYFLTYGALLTCSFYCCYKSFSTEMKSTAQILTCPLFRPGAIFLLIIILQTPVSVFTRAYAGEVHSLATVMDPIRNDFWGRTWFSNARCAYEKGYS